jgi:hypothetical protein
LKTLLAAALTALLATTAQAVETGALTLACNGTWVGGAEGAKPEPASLSLIFNFTAGTVQGFGVPDLDYPIKITGINEATVAFFGSVQTSELSLSLSGTIDRVTGEVVANEVGRETKTGKTFVSTGYSLKCRPTQRMF